MKTIKVRSNTTEKSIRLILFISVLCVFFAVNMNAEMIERVVAIVNKDIILLSEFESSYKKNKAKYPGRTKKDIINEMIGRQLILQEAKKINWFIEKRIKAFIHIPYIEIEPYYIINRGRYNGREFYDVKDEIEEQLISEELSRRVKEYIKTLREKAYIRIQLEEDN
jgi:hypothetical protein